MNLRIQDYKKSASNTAKQVKWWSYAAWTLPFVALAAISFEHYIGDVSMMHRVIWITTTIFFSTSVFWWWWAINKFKEISQRLLESEERFAEIKKELKVAQDIIREDVDRNRQR